MDDFFDACQKTCDKCGSNQYNILLLGTPCTPPDIESVAFRCTQCGKQSSIQIIHFHALVDELDSCTNSAYELTKENK